MQVLNRFTGQVIYETKEESLSGANLSGANLSGANLSVADLSEADLSEADLSEANLSGADLYRANLYRANLYRANLSEADLSEADLSEANLSGAALYRANLYRAKYKDSIILKYFTITRIGTRLDTLQVYILESEVILKTGCFTGSPEELTGQLQLDQIEHQEYLIALAQIDAMAKLYQGGEQL